MVNIRGINIEYLSQKDFFEQANAWEQFTFDAIDKHVTEGSTFVDIGAWNGIFSVYAAKKGAEVYSVEPDFVAVGLYKQLVMVNHVITNLFEGAISDKDGKSWLSSKIWGNSESSIVEREDMNGSYEVDTKTLEQFVGDKQPSLIKMDIEGAEIKVLNQSREFIERTKPNMHISFHPEWIGEFNIDWIFDVYNVVSDGGTITTADNFKKVLANHQHAFLFEGK